MTLQELVDTILEQGGSMETKVIAYIKSEVWELQVAVSEEDGQAYLLEK